MPDVSYSGDVNNGLLIAWSQGDPANVGDIFIFGGTSAGVTAVGGDHRARRPGRAPPRSDSSTPPFTLLSPTAVERP